jgi:hypothetical protein
VQSDEAIPDYLIDLKTRLPRFARDDDRSIFQLPRLIGNDPVFILPAALKPSRKKNHSKISRGTFPPAACIVLL